MTPTEPTVAEVVAGLTKARRIRYDQEKAMGWPDEDCQAFLTGARDHWPSMQRLTSKHLLAKEVG